MTTFARQNNRLMLPKACTYELQRVASVINVNTLWFVPLHAFWCHDGNPFNRRFNRALYPNFSVQPSLGTRSLFRGTMPKRRKPEEKGDAAGTTWPVIAVKDSTSFSNPHAAEEALKVRRAQKQEAIDEEGKKTMEDSPSYSPLEEKEVTPAPEAEAIDEEGKKTMEDSPS